MTRSIAQYDASRAIDAFTQAARFNREDPYRDGARIRLPGYGQVVMTGDIHGHKKNFEKLEKYAMLDRVTARHVILHELVHAEKHGDEIDHSHEVLLLAAEYKCKHPEQVHFLQSNHELAQLTGYQIAKNGRLVIQDYSNAVIDAYGRSRGDDVLEAMNQFIESFPLAILTENRIWMSHSLPNAGDMSEFDVEIFKHAPTYADLKDNKSIFNLVWGRRQSREQLDKLAALLDVDIFIVGHQPQEMGFDFLHDRLIILASDHNHGTFLPFDLSKKLTAEELIRNIRKFVAVA